MDNFEDKENEFSWAGLFIVTGLSFLVFSFVLKLLHGEHIVWFIKIALASIIIGGICYLYKLVITRSAKKKLPSITPFFDNEVNNQSSTQ